MRLRPQEIVFTHLNSRSDFVDIDGGCAIWYELVACKALSLICKIISRTQVVVAPVTHMSTRSVR